VVGVGIIGCGAIGTTLAEAFDTGIIKNAELVAVFDIYEDHMENLVKRLKHKPKKYYEFETFLQNGKTEIIVEAASQEAVSYYAERIISSGMDLMIMSTGALLDEQLLKKIRKAADAHGRYIHVPSGAIGGLDVIKAAKLGGLKKVVLTTRKNPESLKDSAHFKMMVKDPDNMKEAKVIFEGTANDAVKIFPANINVSATLSLAGIGGTDTIVRVIADPFVDKNIHEVEVEGKFGKMKILLENIKHPDNPKTSYLAVLSAIETLRSALLERVLIGT